MKLFIVATLSTQFVAIVDDFLKIKFIQETMNVIYVLFTENPDCCMYCCFECILDWCVVCTRLVCCVYWTGVLYVLDRCVVCTGLVCCMYWTGVLYVLDWCVVCTGLVCCMYWTGFLHGLLYVIHTHGFIYSLWLASELGVGGGGGGEISL